MNCLNDEIRIYFYSQDKEKFLIDYLVPFLKENYERYFIDRDWYEGPNFKVTFLKIDKIQKEKFIEFIESIKDKFQVDEEFFEREREKYLNASKDLSALEKRTYSESIKSHFDIVFSKVSIDYVKGKYNSLKHYEIYTDSRFELQDDYDEILKEIYENNDKKEVILSNMFLYIISLFNGGIERGYLSYVSHVQGFFSLFRKKGISLEDKFEGIYKGLASKILDYDLEDKCFKSWKHKWEKIKNDFCESYDINDFEEEGFYSLTEQNENFKKNMSSLKNSMFHNLLLNNQVDQLSFDRDMIIFRNIVNIFYKTLPYMGIGFVEKHIYLYIAYRYVEDNILHDVWKNELKRLIEENRS